MPIEGMSYSCTYYRLDRLPTRKPESGNMVIMALSYAQWTNDVSILQTYVSVYLNIQQKLRANVLLYGRLQFGILDQWTQFLLTDSLIPQNQLSSDVFAGALANQTNLAIKGIVGIQAMAEIARVTGNTAKYTNYSVRKPLLSPTPRARVSTLYSGDGGIVRSAVATIGNVQLASYPFGMFLCHYLRLRP